MPPNPAPTPTPSVVHSDLAYSLGLGRHGWGVRRTRMSVSIVPNVDEQNGTEPGMISVTMYSSNRVVALVSWILLTVGPFCVSSSAQSAKDVKTPAKIQGETIDSAVSQSVLAPCSSTNAPSESPANAAKGSNATDPSTNASLLTGFAVKDGYFVADFHKLSSYDYDPPTTSGAHVVGGKDEADADIPADIKALDKKKVMVRGFMMPVTINPDNLTTEFILTRNPLCCIYGAPTKLNEIVTVKVAGKGIEPNMVAPVTIKGTLHVGTVREGGDVTGVYRMDGEVLIHE
jgi:hypothetical protein